MFSCSFQNIFHSINIPEILVYFQQYFSMLFVLIKNMALCDGPILKLLARFSLESYCTRFLINRINNKFRDEKSLLFLGISHQCFLLVVTIKLKETIMKDIKTHLTDLRGNPITKCLNSNECQ